MVGRKALPVLVRVSGRVPVLPEAAYAWWTDYDEADHDAPAFERFGWERREVLERDELGRVTRFRDVGRLLGMDITYESTLDYEPPQAVHEVSVSPVGRFEATYAFEADGPRSTRVVWTVHGAPATRVMAALARVPGVRTAVAFPLAKYDLHHHLKEMKRDLSGPQRRRS